MEAYPVPQQDAVQLTLFDVGESVAKLKQPTRAELQRRLDSLRQVKLETEDECERRREIIRRLLKRLEVVNSVLYKQGDVHKELYRQQLKVKAYQCRMKEMADRLHQVHNDYHKLEKTVEKFRPELRCRVCKQTKKIACFAKDVTKLLGREDRCRICIKQKTQKWRAAKLLHSVSVQDK